MKEFATEGEKLTTCALRDKALENPSEAAVMIEQALQVKATTKASLKDIEGTDGALEFQDLETSMEKDIPAGVTVCAKASDDAETTTTCMVSDPIFESFLNSYYPKS